MPHNVGVIADDERDAACAEQIGQIAHRVREVEMDEIRSQAL